MELGSDSSMLFLSKGCFSRIQSELSLLLRSNVVSHIILIIHTRITIFTMPLRHKNILL